jgi:hypothetical protein
MRYALKNGRRVEAKRGLTEIFCECCSSPLLPFCGELNIHHFRHISKVDCDNWYEPMTEWHLAWQNEFPEIFREVVINKNGNKHRADIFNSKGTVLEFQNSPISTTEIQKREDFYDTMIWIFNSKELAGSIYIDKTLKRYTWSNASRSIFSCKKPVFIDIGTEYLFWLNYHSLEKPVFRMRRIGQWQTCDNAIGEIIFKGMGFFNKLRYAAYPIRPIPKIKFISHYGQ